MSLRIGDTAPNFQADTTEGRVDFHQWIGDKWAVLFSHPKDFTPVCTTELGTMAKMKSEFDRRNTQIIGLDNDFDRFVNFRRNKNAGKRCVPALGLIEGRDAHQSVHADFAGQLAKGVFTIDTKRR